MASKKNSDQKIPGELFKEVTKADTSYYDNYQLRPYNPDLLFQKRGNYDLFDEMLHDDQISSVLHLKKLLIIDNKWEIECDDEEIIEFLEYNLRNLPEGFEKNIYDILSALEYGFSLTEKVFGVKDGKIILKDLKTRPPHSFLFHQDSQGRVEKITQYTSSGEDIELIKDKFIHYTYQHQFDNPYGKSELNKGVYSYWYSKQYILKYWNIYLERFGMPTVLGKYPAKYYDQRDELKKTLKNIQAKTSITMPLEVEVSLLESSNKGGGENAFKTAIDHCDTRMARKLLAPDLMGMSGSETSGGSYALGEEHFGIFYNGLETIRNEIERLLNKKIIKPLVEWNFGPDKYAKFRFTRVDEKKREQNLKLFLEYFRNGGRITKEIEDWFSQQIEMPEVDEEQIIEKPKADPVMPKMTEDGEEEMEADDIEETEKMNFVKDDVDLKKVEKDFSSLEKRYSKKILKFLNKGKQNLLNQGKEIVKKKDFNILGLLQPYTSEEERDFRNLLYDFLEESYIRGKQSVQIEEKFELNEDNLDDWLKEQANYIYFSEADSLLKSVQPILSNAIVEGLSTRKIVKQITEKFKNINKTKAELIARTFLSKAYNQSRLDTYTTLDRAGRIVGYDYLATLDANTSSICQELHSGDTDTYYTLAEIKSFWPPNHFNCRSIVRAVFDQNAKTGAKAPTGYEKQGDFWVPKKK